MRSTCQYCGIEFNSVPAAKRKFCSRECWRKSLDRRVKRVCHACGKEFLARHYKAQAGQALYCSRECANTGWEEPCEICGKLVHRAPYHAKRFPHVFCSRDCYAEWRNQRVSYTCKHCNKVFLAKLSEKSVYCSIECRIADKAAKIVEMVCEYCGITFRRKQTDLNLNMYLGKYCSAKCASMARRLPDSVRSVYSHEFTDALKEQIRQRDNHTCQLCGVNTSDTYRELDVHHIDYDKTNNHPDNLITLCDSCHPKTNYHRSHWPQRLKAKMKESISSSN